MPRNKEERYIPAWCDALFPPTPFVMLDPDEWDIFRAFSSAEDIGEMLTAILDYHQTGEEKTFDSRGKTTFFAKAAKVISENKRKYVKSCVDAAYAGYCSSEKNATPPRTPLPFDEWIETAYKQEERRRALTSVDERRPIEYKEIELNQTEQKETKHKRKIAERDARGDQDTDPMSITVMVDRLMEEYTAAAQEGNAAGMSKAAQRISQLGYEITADGLVTR